MTAPEGLVLGARVGTALGLVILLVFGLRNDAGRTRALIVSGDTPRATLAAALASDATGPIESARGAPARLPSGVAPTFAPSLA